MKKKLLVALAVGIGLVCGMCSVPVSAEEITEDGYVIVSPEELDEGLVSGNEILETESTKLSKAETFFSVRDIRAVGSRRDFDVTNGKYKIVLYGGIPSCTYTTKTMQNLYSIYQYLDPQKVEFFCFDMGSNCALNVQQYLERAGMSTDVFVGSRNEIDGAYNMYFKIFSEGKSLGVIDPDTSSYRMPLIAYIDGQGNILSVTTDSQSLESLLDKVSACNMRLIGTPRNGVKNATIEARFSHIRVQNFVNRLYNIALERGAEDAGLNNWVQQLESGKANGANVAYGFFFSEEYKEKNVSNSIFVETLYMVMMDRPSDPTGKKTWVDLLDNGISREYVFRGFSESEEFTKICENYGINRGSVKLTQGRDRNEGATRFVARLYRNVLGREYDVPGLNTWCNTICDKKQSVEYVSTVGFFHSKEFLEKNTSDEEYVKILYRTFLDREYDAPGLKNWLNALKNGKSRDEVLMGFSQSKEFKEIMAKYGL